MIIFHFYLSNFGVLKVISQQILRAFHTKSAQINQSLAMFCPTVLAAAFHVSGMSNILYAHFFLGIQMS